MTRLNVTQELNASGNQQHQNVLMILAPPTEVKVHVTQMLNVFGHCQHQNVQKINAHIMQILLNAGLMQNVPGKDQLALQKFVKS